MRIGIELEYWAVDHEGGLVDADDLVSGCSGVEREFVAPLLEVKTPPCTSVADLEGRLVERLDRVLTVAGAHDIRLAPVATTLADVEVRQSEVSNPRIDVQRAVVGPAFTHAAHCAGTHVHFEQVEGRVADQLRLLTALDPAAALCTTSPYHRGRRVATWARALAYRRRCYGAAPRLEQLWPYPTDASEWRDRLRESYERFVDRAVERGVERSTARTAFDPNDAVWSPVRLRDDLGTVEWRAPDAAPPGAVLKLLDSVLPLMCRAVDRGTRVVEDASDPVKASARSGHWVKSEPVGIPPFEALRELVDEAIAEGIDGRGVRRYLRGFGLAVEEFRPFGARIDGRSRLDATIARRLRLRAADRLERDLYRLRSTDDRTPAMRT